VYGEGSPKPGRSGQIKVGPDNHIPGGFYHLVARGNERRRIYHSGDDYDLFMNILLACIERYSLKVHAFCLMPNHYHILAETQECNLSNAIQYLNGVYSQKFNRNHMRVGHLF